LKLIHYLFSRRYRVIRQQVVHQQLREVIHLEPSPLTRAGIKNI